MSAHGLLWSAPQRQPAARRTEPGAGDAPATDCHMRLKCATRPEHGRVDQLISQFDLARPETYAAFLSINAAALMALRPHWRCVDEADFGALAAALIADLAAIGIDPPTDAQPAPGSIDGLGLAYVVRGSRLGSAILRKRVAAGFPTAYFDVRPALAWQTLLQQVNERGAAGTGYEQAIIGGARATFAVYERLACREGQTA